mmetsp:Transcript_37415/g.115563  ORF Transcript_37415/g.115563 Transcript_37415/m.115563 type:complete len:248 (-) Transcript_37415:668-1411(-)
MMARKTLVQMQEQWWRQQGGAASSQRHQSTCRSQRGQEGRQRVEHEDEGPLNQPRGVGPNRPRREDRRVRRGVDRRGDGGCQRDACGAEHRRQSQPAKRQAALAASDRQTRHRVRRGFLAGAHECECRLVVPRPRSPDGHGQRGRGQGADGDGGDHERGGQHALGLQRSEGNRREQLRSGEGGHGDGQRCGVLHAAFDVEHLRLFHVRRRLRRGAAGPAVPHAFLWPRRRVLGRRQGIVAVAGATVR